MEIRDELYELAELYHEADIQEKGGKAEKAIYREPLLSLMTDIVREEVPLARQTIKVANASLERYGFDYRAWCQDQYPTWTVVEVEGAPADITAITIEENPDLKKYEFVHDGFKFGRTVQMSAPSFDAERFYNDFKKDSSWKHLTDCVEVETITVYKFNETKASAVMAEYPKVKDIFQEYIEGGKPTIKLLPITAIQEED
jgi:hypothetical protein